MSGVRRSARCLKWFSALYVALIVVQVLLAGEGVFRPRTVDRLLHVQESGLRRLHDASIRIASSASS